MGSKVVGDVSPMESHESGTITAEEFVTKTVVIRGMYDALKIMMPAKGVEFQAQWWVSRAQLAQGPGGTGTLTVTMVDNEAAADDPWGAGNTPVIEIEWARIEKPLQSNPKITSGYSGNTLQTLIDEVEAWRNSPQQRRRLYQIPKSNLNREANPNDDNDWITLTGKSLNISKKIAAGIEGYLVFSPIITRTTVTLGKPTTGGCGTITENPPNKINGYVYLKVADTARQQSDGTWQRVEQWQGADAWDEDLYEKV